MDTNKKIALMSDSACDLSLEFLREHNIRLAPLRLYFKDKEYRDRIDITNEQLFMMMELGLPKSSLPSGADVHRILEEIVAQGYTDVLYIGMSSGLSGTYHFIKLLGEDFPGIRFHSVDTKTLSCGLGSLVKAAALELERTNDVDAAIEVVQTIRSKMKAFFVVRDLNYLRRGGRIGLVEGTAGALLHVSPVITVNDDGIYQTAAMSIGFERALDALVREMKKNFNKKRIALSTVYGNTEKNLQAAIRKIGLFCEIAEVSLIPVTSVLAVHTGPGLVGIVAYEL